MGMKWNIEEGEQYDFKTSQMEKVKIWRCWITDQKPYICKDKNNFLFGKEVYSNDEIYPYITLEITEKLYKKRFQFEWSVETSKGDFSYGKVMTFENAEEKCLKAAKELLDAEAQKWLSLKEKLS